MILLYFSTFKIKKTVDGGCMGIYLTKMVLVSPDF